jgi:serine/threonine protein kinase
MVSESYPSAEARDGTPSMDMEAIDRRVAELFPSLADRRRFSTHVDTTDFYKVDYGDVLILDNRPYLILNNAKEGRFGLDDQEKFWVKRATDLETGQRKIIKLVFFEKFEARIGDTTFDCFRSPRKEARILSKVGDHPHFMHGYAAEDSQGNIIRVLDFIYGKSLNNTIEDLACSHSDYFRKIFPKVFANFITCVEAIGFLHRQNEKHGDIRRDHILIDRESGNYRWIDFDFNYRHRENIYGYDLFGIGNILIYLVGKGDVLLPDLYRSSHSAMEKIAPGDRNIVFHHRLANLKLVYPYIPESLNRILLHFSMGANWYYELVDQLLEDLSCVHL